MRLGLSSAAAPDAGLDELLAICARRGLAALDLCVGDAHGVEGPMYGLSGAAAAERARGAGVLVSAFRSGGEGQDLRAAPVAAAAGAPVLVGGGPSMAARVRRAHAVAARGAGAAVVLDGEVSTADLEVALTADLELAWDVDVPGGSVGGAAERIMRIAGGRLRHIRILGGGPEASMQEGQGVGELMSRLALAGYDGTVILAPSSSRYRVAWQHWLGRRGGWGCGSKSADPSLVSLDGPLLGVGGGA
ncbi:MAG: hypothetical protein WEB88_06215 [Gemmatimonadota bacterium]